MIEIKVNDEIRDVATDMFLGLNLRELIWSVLGVIAGVITGTLLYFGAGIPLTIVCYIAVIPILPFAFTAFFRWHGMTFFVLLKTVYASIRYRKDKVYSCENQEYIAFKNKNNKKRKGKKHGIKNIN